MCVYRFDWIAACEEWDCMHARNNDSLGDGYGSFSLPPRSKGKGTIETACPWDALGGRACSHDCVPPRRVSPTTADVWSDCAQQARQTSALWRDEKHAYELLALS